MKIEIARYISKCDTCQRVKVVHLKSAGELQPLPIPSWKWEDISMDFIVGLPKTSRGFDSIWVIVDRLTKSAHFLLVKIEHSAMVYAKLYITRILSLHGVLKTSYLIEVHSLSIISRGTYMSLWVLNYYTVLLIILKQMVRLKESIRF
jgi:hypothetical protein